MKAQLNWLTVWVGMVIFLMLTEGKTLARPGGTEPAPKWQELQTQLLEVGYNLLFQEGNASKREEIWDEGKNQSDLQALILAPEADPAAKFLAANLLMNHSWVPEEDEIKTVLADVFTQALLATKNPQGPYKGLNGNAWSYPFETPNLEVLGTRFTSLGEPAVQALGKLLEDIDFIPYEGSEQANVAHENLVRVKDIATTIIVQIRNFEWEWSPKPVVRDASIGFMRKHLGF